MRKPGRTLLRAANRLLVGEATKALVASPGAGYRLVIYRVIATVLTAAAQAVEVGVDTGTVAQQLFVIRASGVEPVYWESEDGFDMPAATALSAKPAAAGPAVQFWVEYAIEAISPV